MKHSRLIFASACAASSTILFVVLITIWAELSVPLKDWLKQLSGHHWVTKSIFSMVVYGVVTSVVYLLPVAYSDARLKRMLTMLIVCTVLGTIAMTAFFTGHYVRLW